ncbi:conserved Plasmodium protein, unknown function [Plasmodium gallinaceum]|uniref:RNA-binding protein 25 n=1 Tax=Plasmodium gallinaceum TaxID=5849 RepID=A0A1J1GRM0_PLAGA|nr:conserved Plasmodium protein, unknown function [Plasmodium gallinaceum]CRG93682.1 conserved Plasmodium protein, unknown function [Plasmodium gallinaceum]
MINNRVYYSNLKLVVNKGEEKEEIENANNVIYVGNIDKYIEDNDILGILQIFGDVYKWHRQRNPSTNELMPFGFCEYNDIYGVYLCIQILDNIKLANKNLKVNCNDNLKKKFEGIVDILYEKKQKTIEKENELLNDKDMKNQILNDIKNDINSKKNDVLAYIQNINNEYEEKKRKDEVAQNNTGEDEKNLSKEEKDKREKIQEEENLNMNNIKLNHEQDNINYINSISPLNNDELNINEKKKISKMENDENCDILGIEKKNGLLTDNSNNQQLNNKNMFKSNSSQHNNEGLLKEKEEVKYLSKDYKVHWRERERIQKIENKEKDLEKDFYKREKEWLELEEQIKKDTYKEWNKLMLIKKKDIARLIELDLKGEYENSNISNSKKREIRNSKREKEKELDELDRLNELKEIEEMKEKLKNKEKLINDNIQNDIEQKDVINKEPEIVEECKKEENNSTKENLNVEEPKDRDEKIPLENNQNRNNTIAEHSKNNIAFDFSCVSDKNNEIKCEKENVEHDEDLKKKDKIFENKEDYLMNEYNENENIKKEKENNFNNMNHNNNIGIDTYYTKNYVENQNNENILTYQENNFDITYKSENKESEVLNKTFNENDTNENNMNEKKANEISVNENSINENNTNKRKMICSEHINIKVNDKKKKTDSENLNKINNPVLMNVFNTNDEDELFTKKHQPLSKLDKHLDKKNQEEEKIKAIEIIENSKKILEKVPSTEEEIFNFHIEWNVLNLKDNIGVKLKPWIYKKITEYIGKDEKEIIEEISNYFVQQILKETSPKDMLVEAEKFLDSDGKKFILNMYRLIIFEQLKIKNSL